MSPSVAYVQLQGYRYVMTLSSVVRQAPRASGPGVPDSEAAKDMRCAALAGKFRLPDLVR